MIGVLILAAGAAVILKLVYDSLIRYSYKNLPPGPVSWPIIGNMFNIDQGHPQDTMEKYAQQYGPIFRLWFGSQLVVVLNNADAIKEALVRQADNFAGRPFQYIFDEVISQGRNGIIHADGGTYRELRRFSLSVLRDFGFGKSKAENLIHLEVEELIGELDQLMKRSGKVDPKPGLKTSIVNVITQLLFDKKFAYDDPDFETYQANTAVVIADATRLAFLNFFPWLRYLSPTQFGFQRFVSAVQSNRGFIEKRIDEHKRDLTESAEPYDFIGRFLQDMKRHGGGSGYRTHENMSNAASGIYTAGFETTVSTLMWLILYLTEYPDIQERMHQEILDFTGQPGKSPEWENRNSLPYTNAVITETQRMGSIVPLGVFHRNFKSTRLLGYNIPANTMVITNLQSTLRDESYFPDPGRFDPTRYLEESGVSHEVIKNRKDAVIPFSVGRRVCLGESLARMELFLFATGLVTAFKMSFPEDEPKPTMKGRPGFTTSPHFFNVVFERT